MGMRSRLFKTKWFSRAAGKARITDEDLAAAVEQIELGQADDLGGGVFKKRLNENRHRSIVLASAGRFWVYEYLFAKKDRANIDADELEAFRKIAKAYAGLSDLQLEKLIASADFVEICSDKKN